MTLLFTLFFACQGDTESGFFSTSGNNTVDTDSLTGNTGDGQVLNPALVLQTVSIQSSPEWMVCL